MSNKTEHFSYKEGVACMGVHILRHLRYSTDLTQRCTHIRVIGHHSSSARTQLSMSFNGLELELALEFERKPRASS